MVEKHVTERTIKQWLRAKMKQRFPAAIHFAIPGSRYGKRGMPDDHWWIPTFVPALKCMLPIDVAIESKSDGKEPTKLQQRTLGKFNECGALTFTMIGRDENRLWHIIEEIEALRNKLRALK